MLKLLMWTTCVQDCDIQDIHNQSPFLSIKWKFPKSGKSLQINKKKSDGVAENENDFKMYSKRPKTRWNIRRKGAKFNNFEEKVW